MLNSLGFDTLLLALEKSDPAGVRESLSYFQKAEEKGTHGGKKATQGDDPMESRPLARLAAGESREIDPEVYHQLAEAGDTDLIISGFTDLGVLEKYYPGLHAGKNCHQAVEQAKQRLVAAFPPATLATGRHKDSTVPDCDDPPAPGRLPSWCRRIR